MGAKYRQDRLDEGLYRCPACKTYKAFEYFKRKSRKGDGTPLGSCTPCERKRHSRYRRGRKSKQDRLNEGLFKCPGCAEYKPFCEYSSRKPCGKPRNSCKACNNERAKREWHKRRDKNLKARKRRRQDPAYRARENELNRKANIKRRELEAVAQGRSRHDVRKDRLRRAGMLALDDDERAWFRAQAYERYKERLRERYSAEDHKRKYYAIKNDPERWRKSVERKKAWRKKNKDKVRAYARKSCARRRGADTGEVPASFIVELLERKVCYLCGDYVPRENRQIEHVRPISRGGMHEVGNLEMACPSCNSAKSNKDPFEYAHELRWLKANGLCKL